MEEISLFMDVVSVPFCRHLKYTYHRFDVLIVIM
jgi:hypothetical protein